MTAISITTIRDRFHIREKLMKIRENPVKVSLGYALGVFLGTTPFIGTKVFIALILTSIFKWNRVSSVIGVYHINLFTAPFFYGLAFLTGSWILGYDADFVFPESMTFAAFTDAFLGNSMIFYSLLLGGCMLGVPMAAGAYWFSYRIIASKPSTPKPPEGGLLPSLFGEGTGEGYKIRRRRSKSPSGDLGVYTLITGASSGLGREMAIECASQGMNVILIALPGRNLDVLCSTLEREYGIRARYFEIDLTRKEAIHGMVESILSQYRVNFLINNAGTGGTVPFEKSSVDYLERIIQLNITAVSLLTRLLLPELKRHQRAWILNVSSMAAFSPFPYKTIYPASKAFVANFSRSLGEELKDTGVSVGVLHPGPILTNPDVTIRIIRQGSKGRRGLISARELARMAIEGIRMGKQVMVPGIANKLNRWMMTYLPGEIVLSFLSKVVVREIREEQQAAA